MKRPKFLTEEDLIPLGFTNKLIKHLPQPEYRPSPKSPKGPVVRSWKRAEVEAVMNSPAFAISQIRQRIKVRHVDSIILWFKYQEYRKLHPHSSITTDRFYVNCIRHEYTDYESDLEWLESHNKNPDDAYLLFKAAVLEAIADEYPELKKEAQAQAAAAVRRLPGDVSATIRQMRF